MSSSNRQSSILKDIDSRLSEFENRFGDLRTRIKEALEVARKAEEDKKAELDTKDVELSKLKQSNVDLVSKLGGYETQLQKLSKTYQELSGRVTEQVDVKELLTIYVTLLEEVFEGRPHAKILWLLHGKKQSLTRSEINNTSGVQPAIVLKSIYDLANANLVNYNETTQEVTVKRKLY
jgi:hypothetical protein